jgi:hypothetical protein
VSRRCRPTRPLTDQTTRSATANAPNRTHASHPKRSSRLNNLLLSRS